MANNTHSMEHLRYKGRVTIVTGGSRGIGYGVVKVFVQNGSNVIFADTREDIGAKVEKELNEKGPGQCMFVKCDLSKEQDVKCLVETTIQKYGRLDCLVNNAGTHPAHSTIDGFTADDMTWLHGINVMGYFYASKYCLPHLRKTQGNIINNGSLVAKLGQSGALSYAATKGAIMSMTKALAIDEAEYLVRVNTFSPGNILTPLWKEVGESGGDLDKALEDGRNSQLIGRLGTVEECGLVCLFLAADATFCTGININVSGGAELNYGKKNRLTE